jgi:hypothetical protein
MLGKALGLITRRKKSAEPEGTVTSNESVAPIGNISKLLNPSGRIGPQTLHKMAEVYEKPEFVRFMRQAVLVGSSIQAGSFSNQARTGSDEMNRTIIFEVDLDEKVSSTPESLKHAIYPLVKRDYVSGTRTTFSVGRVDGNDLIMSDLAISKQHAFLKIQHGDYWIQDGGSTNGTKLNGKRVTKKPVQVRDGDIIGFARYEFSLLSPESLYNILKAPEV